MTHQIIIEPDQSITIQFYPDFSCNWIKTMDVTPLEFRRLMNNKKTVRSFWQLMMTISLISLSILLATEKAYRP